MGSESADEVGGEHAGVFDYDAPHGHDGHDHHDHHDHCGHDTYAGRGYHHDHDRAPYNELAIVGVVTAVIFWPVGLLTSLLARREAHLRGQRGGELALVGIVLSALAGLAWSIILVAAVAGGINGPGWGRVQFTRVVPAPVHGVGVVGAGIVIPGGINPGGPIRGKTSVTKTSSSKGYTWSVVIGHPTNSSVGSE